MPCRRCSLCGIHFPAIAQFMECPVHEEATTWLGNVEPDENWKEAFEAVQTRADAVNDVKRPLPLVHGVEPYDYGGKLFIRQMELQRAGLRLSHFHPDQFYLFELDDGVIYETQGWSDALRSWWIEPVPLTIEVSDVE